MTTMTIAPKLAPDVAASRRQARERRDAVASAARMFNAAVENSYTLDEFRDRAANVRRRITGANGSDAFKEAFLETFDRLAHDYLG